MKKDLLLCSGGRTHVYNPERLRKGGTIFHFQTVAKIQRRDVIICRERGDIKEIFNQHSQIMPNNNENALHPRPRCVS